MPHPVRVRVNRITEQFWNDAEVLFRVGQYFLWYKEPDMALKRFTRALVLQPHLAEALFQRAFCHRLLRNDAEAAEDLLHYLRDHGSQGPDGEFCDVAPVEKRTVEMEKQIRTRQERNQAALLELLSISLDSFLKTLELPPVQVPWRGNSHGESWLVWKVPFHLIQQHRWEDAIRYLEHQRVKDLSDSGTRSADLRAVWSFYLAMAQWGKVGEPRPEFCSEAILALQPVLDADAGDLATAWFQELALLFWGAGDPERASDALDQALARLDEQGEVLDDVSYWTFQETTPREYRFDCEEMRRMIRGEPVRPAFLAPPH
jgi:tetratricopeptide (TPR) repeat protein